MKKLQLIRTYKNEATIGTVYHDKRKICETLERPNLNNQKDNPATPENESSCISEGEYLCKRYSSEKFPDTWEVTNVPNRSKILFHPANKINELLGCIAPCRQVIDMNPRGVKDVNSVNRWYASQSRDGFAALKEEVEDEDFMLEITRAYSHL